MSRDLIGQYCVTFIYSYCGRIRSIDLLINIYTQRCRICQDSITCGQRYENSTVHGSWTNRCYKLYFISDYSDLFRTLLSELFIYPIVVYSMFRFIIGLKSDVSGRYRTENFVLNVVFPPFSQRSALNIKPQCLLHSPTYIVLET